MTWQLKSADGAFLLNVQAGDDGALSGFVDLGGSRFQVAGGWAASGSIPGRNASAFALSGRTTGQPDVPAWLSASGIMIGPGDRPQSIEVQADSAASSDGHLRHYAGTLRPA